VKLLTSGRHISDEEVAALRRARHSPSPTSQGLSKKRKVSGKELPNAPKAALLLSQCGRDADLRVLPV